MSLCLLKSSTNSSDNWWKCLMVLFFRLLIHRTVDTTASNTAWHQQVHGSRNVIILRPLFSLIEIIVCLFESKHFSRLDVTSRMFSFLTSIVSVHNAKSQTSWFRIRTEQNVLTWLNCIRDINMHVIAVIFRSWCRLVDNDVGEKCLISQYFRWKINSVYSTRMRVNKMREKLVIKYLVQIFVLRARSTAKTMKWICCQANHEIRFHFIKKDENNKPPHNSFSIQVVNKNFWRTCDLKVFERSRYSRIQSPESIAWIDFQSIHRNETKFTAIVLFQSGGVVRPIWKRLKDGKTIRLKIAISNKRLIEWIRQMKQKSKPSKLASRLQNLSTLSWSLLELPRTVSDSQ